jgi:hypothetical protein
VGGVVIRSRCSRGSASKQDSESVLRVNSRSLLPAANDLCAGLRVGPNDCHIHAIAAQVVRTLFGYVTVQDLQASAVNKTHRFACRTAGGE